MTDTRLLQLRKLWRYYQAAIVNTVFGYGLYTLLVFLGLNMYVAQAVAQVLGVCFNYVTYSRHTFKDSQGSKPRFAAAYVLNYLLQLGFLALAARFVESPYIAGLISLIIVSLINFFILNRLVFTRPAAG